MASPWTSEEEDLLREKAPQFTVGELRFHFFRNRSAATLHEKLKEMEVSALKKKVPWSKEEILILRKKASNHTVLELRDKFFPKRTANTIRQKCYYEKIKPLPKNKPWSKTEIRKLRKLSSKEKTINFLVKESFPKRNYDQLIKKLNELSLPYKRERKKNS